MILRLALAVLLLLTGCTLPNASGSLTPAASTILPTPSTTPAPSTGPTAIPASSNVQLSTPSASVVWAFVSDSHLFRSTDQGATWTERSLPSGPIRGNVSFVNDQEGWLAAPGAAATQCQLQPVSLWRSGDGGGTWLPLNATGIAGGRCKEKLVFLDSLHGFLNAWDPNVAPVVYRTTDGGQSWAPSRPLPDPPGFITTGAGFTLRAGAVHGFGATLLLDAFGNSAGQPHRYTFGSTDSGVSWTYRTTAPDPMIAVTFITASRWLQLGGAGQSRETTDAGTSWHAFATDYSEAAPPSAQVVFGDLQLGYATVRGTLKRTLDGGTHWTLLRTPGT